VIGRWGRAGALVFFAVFTTRCFLRDLFHVANTHIFAFGPGAALRIADASEWFSIAVLVQLVIGWLAGPAKM